MLEVTQTATEAIRGVIAEAGPDIVGLRIAVASGGCAGIRYDMFLDSATQEGDDILMLNGVTLLVDSDSMRLLEGTTIDFRNDLPEAGFVFDNPNAQGLCSCSGGSCGDDAASGGWQ